MPHARARSDRVILPNLDVFDPFDASPFFGDAADPSATGKPSKTARNVAGDRNGRATRWTAIARARTTPERPVQRDGIVTAFEVVSVRDGVGRGACRDVLTHRASHVCMRTHDARNVRARRVTAPGADPLLEQVLVPAKNC